MPTQKSQDLEKRLLLAKQRQSSYRPSDRVAQQLKEITLGSLIGVTSIGKSHLISSAVHYGGADFSEVGNISSRARRASDPNNFRGSQSIKTLLGRIERGEMVNYMIHPSGDIYGTDIDSYTTKFTLLPTLTSSLEQLQAMNCFKRVIPIGLVADALTWEARLNDTLHDAKAEVRMREALDCTAWLKSHLHSVPILDNKNGNEAISAKAIISIMKDTTHPHALDNLEQVSSLLSQLTDVATKNLQKFIRHDV